MASHPLMPMYMAVAFDSKSKKIFNASTFVLSSSTLRGLPMQNPNGYGIP
jgi:hypothetical protein